MEFDINKVFSGEEDIAFFKEHCYDLIVSCMRLKPSVVLVDLNENEIESIRIKAMNMVAEKYKYGPYQHLCDTCEREFIECVSDPMFGKCPENDNVCYCESYEER